jgi:hypothetical protein
MGRPFLGAYLGGYAQSAGVAGLNGRFSWNGGPFIPDEQSFAGNGIVTGNLTGDPATNVGSFNWVTTLSAFDTSMDTAQPLTFGASVQINTNQTIAYLQAGPNGNCGQLLNACLNDAASTARTPNTISTDVTQIGGGTCVQYFQNCQVSTLLQQPGNSVMATNANPQGLSGGFCKDFPVGYTPSCNDVLPIFQQSAPDFSCACTSQSQTPFCQVYCPYILTAWQVDTGPTATCACASQTSVGAPNCTQNCLGQISAAQQAKGNGYTCGCPVNGALTPPQCAQNCGGLLPTFQAQYPNYTCTCPSGTAVVTNPVCVPTCSALAQSQQAADGPNYTCSCQDPASTTEQPSCPMNCGGMMATNSTYQTNANQVCSCPSGGNSVTTPSCVPTCGSQLASTTCALGSVAQCPNGNANTGTPQCVQQTCGTLQPTWGCPTNQVATCANSSALSNPVCQTTCGSQLSGTTCSAGSVAVCANGNNNPGTPTCQQQTCGTLQPTWGCQSGDVATCPSGTTATSNPVCAPTCGSQLASTSCAAGQLATCTAGNNSTTAPTCVQQACGSLLSTWSCSGGVTPTCPNGSAALSNPSCTPPTCQQKSAGMTCQAGYGIWCSSTYATPYCTANCYQILSFPQYNGLPYYCSTQLGVLPQPVNSSTNFTFLMNDSPCTDPNQVVSIYDPVCGQATKAICTYSISGGYQWYAYASNWYNGYPISGSTCFAKNYYTSYMSIPITNGRIANNLVPNACQYGLSYSVYPNMQVYGYGNNSGCN